MPRFVLIHAPSILGLRPTGVERMGEVLEAAGLGRRLGAELGGRVEPPPYDFGLVRAMGGIAEIEGPALTRANALQGTPAFMAPEQALGESAVDSRADIYASGCVAYWLLTGQFVFTDETPMGLVLQHVQTQPTPPSARDPTADSRGPRSTRHVVPGKGPSGTATDCEGVVAPPDRGLRGGGSLD